MAPRSLSVADVAAEIGRSPRYVYDNWRRLCSTERMPRPVSVQSLSWNAAQFYSWLDRRAGLTAKEAAAVAAYRAAQSAYQGAADPADTHYVAERRAALAARYQPEESGT